MSASTPLIQLHNIYKTYPTSAGPVEVLHGLTLDINAGELTAIVGKSGSGKSTLLNLITGIDLPTSGEVEIGGTAVQTLDENHRAIWRGENVGIVFQFFQLMPTLTVFENVLLPMELCKPRHTTPPEARAHDLLAMVGLGEHGHKFPSKLSGGQQQRAALARALANDPPLLVADEPTGNLDSHTAADVFNLFQRLVAAGKTIVLVTHDSDLARQAQRVITLVDGHISSAA